MAADGQARVHYGVSTPLEVQVMVGSVKQAPEGLWPKDQELGDDQ